MYGEAQPPLASDDELEDDPFVFDLDDEKLAEEYAAALHVPFVVIMSGHNRRCCLAAEIGDSCAPRLDDIRRVTPLEDDSRAARLDEKYPQSQDQDVTSRRSFSYTHADMLQMGFKKVKRPPEKDLFPPAMPDCLPPATPDEEDDDRMSLSYGMDVDDIPPVDSAGVATTARGKRRREDAPSPGQRSSEAQRLDAPAVKPVTRPSRTTKPIERFGFDDHATGASRAIPASAGRVPGTSAPGGLAASAPRGRATPAPRGRATPARRVPDASAPRGRAAPAPESESVEDEEAARFNAGIICRAVERRNHDDGQRVKEQRTPVDVKHRAEEALALAAVVEAERVVKENADFEAVRKATLEERAEFDLNPPSEAAYLKRVKQEHKKECDDARVRAEAGGAVTMPPREALQILFHLRKGHLERLQVLAIPWRGIAMVSLQYKRPLPRCFPATQLALVIPAIANLLRDYPWIDTLADIGYFTGAMFSDAGMDCSGNFVLASTNREFPWRLRANLPGLNWNDGGDPDDRVSGRWDAEGVYVHTTKCSNGTPSEKHRVVSPPQSWVGGATKYSSRGSHVWDWYPEMQCDQMGSKRLPRSYVDDPLDREFMMSALTATPAAIDGLVVGDTTCDDTRVRHHLNDFTVREHEFISEWLGRVFWRDGTTGEIIHGGFPVRRRHARNDQHVLEMYSDILEENGYLALHSSTVRTHRNRLVDLLLTAPRALVLAYAHKVACVEDIDWVKRADEWRASGASYDHIVRELYLIRVFSFEEIQEAVQKHTKMLFARQVLYEKLGSLGLVRPAHRTCEKTGNDERTKLNRCNVRDVNVVIQKVREGGNDAVSFGGLDEGGEASIQHWLKWIAPVFERQGYVIDHKRYRAIVPSGMIGSTTDWTEEEIRDQELFVVHCKTFENNMPPLLELPGEAEHREHFKNWISAPEKSDCAKLVSLPYWIRARRDTNTTKLGFQCTLPDGTTKSTVFQTVKRALRFVRSEKYPNEYVQEAQQLGLRGQ